MTTDNPYAPPTANVADPAPEISNAVLIPYGRRAPAGDGAKWIGSAFSLYFKRPWKWIGLIILWFIILGIVSSIPFVNLISTLLWPAWSAGFVYTADLQRRTGNFSIRDMFYGFGPLLGQLAIVGGVMLLGSVVSFGVMAALVDLDTARAVYLSGEIGEQALTLEFWLAVLVSFALVLPITAATYFAPALMLFHALPPSEAMKMSFVGLLQEHSVWARLWCVALVADLDLHPSDRTRTVHQHAGHDDHVLYDVPRDIRRGGVASSRANISSSG